MEDDYVPEVIADAGEFEEYVYVVGIRESATPDAWSMLFQECFDEDDEQEIKLGMDTYCLVVDPGQRTVYGGVLAYQIDSDHLRFVLSQETADTLELPAELTFSLRLAPDVLEMLSKGLERVFTSGRPDAFPERLS